VLLSICGHFGVAYMFRDKTTFVIGAGASAEFGLPVGTQLAMNIRDSARIASSKLHGLQIVDEDLEQAIKIGWPEFTRDEIIMALRRIHAAIDTSISIDAFIHRNRDDPVLVHMGKALIAWNIAKAEAQSKMKAIAQTELGETIDRSQLTDTWIGKFTRILFDGVSDIEQIPKQVSIICFNYDRCIEAYLIESIMIAFNVDRLVAEGVVNDMNIIHPYGYLGKVTNNPFDVKDDECLFAYPVQSNFPLRQVANRIRTYTEQTDSAELISDIHLAIDDAHNLVFLGFGFNNQNLDLLRVVEDYQPGLAKEKNVYASGYGLKEEIKETLCRRITHIYYDFPRAYKKKYFDRIYIGFGLSCSELMGTHDLNLNKFLRRKFSVVQHGHRISVAVQQLDRAGAISDDA